MLVHKSRTHTHTETKQNKTKTKHQKQAKLQKSKSITYLHYWEENMLSFSCFLNVLTLRDNVISLGKEFQKPGPHVITPLDAKFVLFFLQLHCTTQFLVTLVWELFLGNLGSLISKIALVFAYHVNFSLYGIPSHLWERCISSWFYRGQTGKCAPILLAMVSKCSSSKYNEKSE